MVSLNVSFQLGDHTSISTHPLNMLTRGEREREIDSTNVSIHSGDEMSEGRRREGGKEGDDIVFLLILPFELFQDSVPVKQCLVECFLHIHSWFRGLCTQCIVRIVITLLLVKRGRSLTNYSDPAHTSDPFLHCHQVVKDFAPTVLLSETLLTHP